MSAGSFADFVSAGSFADFVSGMQCQDMLEDTKTPLGKFLRGVDVLRTGIEPYMIISKLAYLQAVLQAVKEGFCKFCNYCSSGFSKGSSSGD